MSVQMMVTISGSNQVDLVKTLSEKTHTLGGKWLNSKINHIDDYFSGLIKVEIGSECVDRLISDFQSLAINVTAVVLEPTAQNTLTHMDLSIDAKDRPGLVHEISLILGENSVRVENMECHRLGLADISGTVFTSHFKIAVTDSFDREALINALQEISDDLVIDLHG